MALNYKDLQAQIQALQKQAEAARQAEIASAIAEIKAKMREHRITVEDLVGVRLRKGPKTPPGPVAAKYRDPESGKTWSGRGKAPRWIEGKDRAGFVIG